MLKLGEKGAILQRDKETYAIAPHIPCGLVTPQLLRTLADVAEKYDVQAIKITGATRMALLGLKEEYIDAAWSELHLDIGAAVGLCVRSVRTCPGTPIAAWVSRMLSGWGWRSIQNITAWNYLENLRWPCPVAI